MKYLDKCDICGKFGECVGVAPDKIVCESCREEDKK